MWMMREMRVRLRDTRLSCGLAHCGIRVAPGDKVPVLELRTARLLCRQLELDEHHVIAHTERQREGGAAREEVADL